MKKRKKSILETVRRYHELILFLTYREIRIRYKQTLLGVAWAVLQPLLQMVVFTFVFFKLGKMQSGEAPYHIFVFSGLLPWALFAGALSRGVPIIINYPNLVTKIYFPREIFPIFATLGLLVDFVCSLAVLLVFFFVAGIPFQLGILYGFFVILIVTIFSIGILFFISTMNVFFRDITYVVPLLSQAWLFMTPVVYPIEKVPQKFRFWYDLNPMVGLVQAYRDLTLEGHLTNPNLFLQASIASIIIFYLGYRYLKHYEMKFADVI